MARARNIKPGFFTNDRLAECSPLARLLFAGLWTIADRAGRLEDRPKRIKAELLPYDECDAESLLNDLQRHGFIKRYEANGAAFIQVLAFTKHQNPHMREPESTIPAPDKHSASTVQAEEKPEPARLIPDSPSLIPSKSTVDAPASTARPSIAEISAYCAERGNLVDPQAWFDHYTANGWRVGKNPMKDWRAAVRTWERGKGTVHAKPAKFNPAAYSRELAARAAAGSHEPAFSADAGDVRPRLVIDVPGR